MADEIAKTAEATPVPEAAQQKLTPEQIQRMLAARQQQQQGGGISLPFGDGSGAYTNMKDEVISLFFLTQQGVLSPEEARKAINEMKKQLELDEISKDEWDNKFGIKKPEMKK